MEPPIREEVGTTSVHHDSDIRLLSVRRGLVETGTGVGIQQHIVQPESFETLPHHMGGFEEICSRTGKEHTALKGLVDDKTRGQYRTAAACPYP